MNDVLLRIDAIRTGYFNATAGHLDVEALLCTRAYQLSPVGSLLKLFNTVLYAPLDASIWDAVLDVFCPPFPSRRNQINLQRTRILKL